MKNLATFIFLTTFIACNQATEPIPLNACILPGEVSQSGNDRDCVIPKKNLDANLSVDVFLRDFNQAQENKMSSALARLQHVLNSEEFRQRILNHKYQNKKTFVDNRGMSNQEVYEEIMKGAETLSNTVDEVLNLDITLYFSNNSVVGYTYPNSTRIWVNNKFFAQYSYGKVAGNVAHEWTHKLGFGHDFNRTSSRVYSVPYAVGNIVAELVEKM